MLDEPTREAIGPMARLMQLIGLALTLGVVAFLFVAVVLIVRADPADAGNGTSDALLTLIGCFVLIGGVFAREVMGRKMLSHLEPPPTEADMIADPAAATKAVKMYLAGRQTTAIIQAALVEGPTFLCIALAIVGPWYLLIPAVVGLLILAFTVPSESSIGDAIVQHRNRAAGGMV